MSSDLNNNSTANEDNMLNLLNKAAEIEDVENKNVDTSYRMCNYTGFYTMVAYINKNKTDVPEQLRNKCMRNEFGLTLAMYWLTIMKKQIALMILQNNYQDSVPLWMRHDPELKDDMGWTIAMHWVSLFKCDVPLWMRHTPTLQNNKHKTIAMLYLINLADELNDINADDVLPEWMKHEPDIFDEDGYSIIDYWLECTTHDIPDWLNTVNEFTNNNGETIAMSYVIHRHEIPPIKYKHDPNLKSKYNLTIEELCTNIIHNVNIPEWMHVNEEK